jgi:hypoxanthine phosphoribosyltransferase
MGVPLKIYKGVVQELSKGMKELINNFVNKIGEEVRKWVGDDPIVVVGLIPDGVFYAGPLSEYLKKYHMPVEYLEMDTEELKAPRGRAVLKNTQGEPVKSEILNGKKVLMVNNISQTGRTYMAIKNWVKKEKITVKDLKFAVYEDRTGLADFRYKASVDVLTTIELFERIKQDLEKLKPKKEKLLQVWNEIPKEYRGEMLAVLLSNTRQWQEFTRETKVDLEQIMLWLRGAMHRAAYAYPEIKIPNGFQTSDPIVYFLLLKEGRIAPLF